MVASVFNDEALRFKEQFLQFEIEARENRHPFPLHYTTNTITMKKYIILLITTLVLVGCSTLRTPAKMDRFVDQLERRAYRYSPEDWRRANQKYKVMLQEYVDNYRMFTTEEKRTAMRAIGRYHGLLVEHGVREATGVVGSLGSYAGGLLDILGIDPTPVMDFLEDVLGMGRAEAGRVLERLRDRISR